MVALIAYVKEFLPTPWSRRVVSLTATLAGIIVLLPQWWSSVVGPTPIEQPTLLARLFLLSTILFLGSFITLSLVVRAYNELIKKHEKEIAKITTSPPPPPPPIEYKRKYLA